MREAQNVTNICEKKCCENWHTITMGCQKDEFTKTMIKKYR